jgi:hypothetical protein
MDRARHGCDHRRMTPADETWPAAADAIVQAGLWCVVESRNDAAPTDWEPRLIICRTELGGIADAIDSSVAAVASRSDRIAGYTRDTLVRVESAPTARCYTAEALAESA